MPFKVFLTTCVFITWMALCLPLGFLLRSWLGDMPEYVVTWQMVNDMSVIQIPFAPVPTDIFAAFFGAYLLTLGTFLLCDTKRIFWQVT